MTSPFQYGTIATGKAFVNRDKERRQLKQHLMSGINVMLISPRRWGKSSLVKEAMNELKEEENEVAICFIDAMTILSEQEFYENFSKDKGAPPAGEAPCRAKSSFTGAAARG